MDSYVRIATLENDVEACLLDSLLNERQIAHMVQSFHDSAYDGMFQLQKGWGCVIGPEECKREIMEILTDLRNNPAPDGTSSNEG